MDVKYKRFIKKVFRRLGWYAKGCPKPTPMLEMIFPENKSEMDPIIATEGYTLRQYKKDEQEKYFSLLESAGMEPCSFKYWDKHILPEGLYVVEHNKTGDLVGTCMASHHSTIKHERAGNLGWVAVDPKHRGKKLGKLVCTAVTKKLIDNGYKRIYLETEDFRYSAIKIYLSMGWLPLLDQEEMYKRWQDICEKIKWPFTPNDWAKQ